MTKRLPVFAAIAATLAFASAMPDAYAQKRAPQQERPPQRDDGAPLGETIGRITPQQMAGVLRNRGATAEIVSENNRSRIRTQIGGRRVTVFFYACNDGGCQSIQYRAVFQRNDRYTLAYVNAWNYEKRFAKTYLDNDGDLVLEWDVDLDGGVSVPFISESVQTFQTMLGAFDRFTPRDATPGGSRGRGPSDGQGPSGRSAPPSDVPPPATGGKGGSGVERPGERRT
ncbi:YbjN domain-containing protein [Phreatobacter aquaticus]|nr:YbjN domain-containing protein [Phreatobacter aquaticus]